MRQRCSNPNNIHYENYKKLGVSVCKHWDTFASFIEDMGERPSKIHSIERVDNFGNYEPSNCKWATPKEQGNNRSNNHKVSYMGRVQTVSQWADEIGINSKTIYTRLRRGWSPERALNNEA